MRIPENKTGLSKLSSGRYIKITTNRSRYSPIFNNYIAYGPFLTLTLIIMPLATRQDFGLSHYLIMHTQACSVVKVTCVKICMALDLYYHSIFT